MRIIEATRLFIFVILLVGICMSNSSCNSIEPFGGIDPANADIFETGTVRYVTLEGGFWGLLMITEELMTQFFSPSNT
ncbi:MAG: hypothetical protein HN929_09290 [Chloroflexi bacterium]|nr:hypothetical protein [Chloroflexota bacterium]